MAIRQIARRRLGWMADLFCSEMYCLKRFWASAMILLSHVSHVRSLVQSVSIVIPFVSS